MGARIHHRVIHFWLIGLAVVVYPFSIRYSNATVLLLTAHWVIWFIREPGAIRLAKPSLWIMTVCFLTAVFSLLYTSNMRAGLFVLDKKIWLFLLPLVLGSIEPLPAERFRRLIALACASVLAGMLYCLFIAFFLNPKPLGEGLYWQELVRPLEMHPTYISLYINFLNACLLLTFISRMKISGIREKAGYLIVMGLFCAFLVLLASKIQLVFAGVIFFLAILGATPGLKLKLMVIPVCLLIYLAVNWKMRNTYTIDRFRHITTLSYNMTGDIEAFNEITLRLAVLECAWTAVKDDLLLGFGAGDVATELDRSYRRIGFRPGYVSKLNPHNEYLSQLLAGGLLGLGLFLFMLCVNIRAAFLRKNIPYLVLLSLFLVNFFFESMLELQRGIFLFSLFISLYYFHGERTEGPWGSGVIRPVI